MWLTSKQKNLKAQFVTHVVTMYRDLTTKQKSGALTRLEILITNL